MPRIWGSNLLRRCKGNTSISGNSGCNGSSGSRRGIGGDRGIGDGSNGYNISVTTAQDVGLGFF